MLWGVYRFTLGVPQRLPLPFPVPAPFFWDNLWATFGGLVQETVVKPDFLLGQVSTGGWWYYFPVAIAVKTPLPLLILFAAGLAALARKREWRRQGMVWLPVLAFVGMGLTGVLTIGYRHMLPAVPFAILLAGNAADWLWAGAGHRWGTRPRGMAQETEFRGDTGSLPTAKLAPLRVAVGGLLVGWLIIGTL